jgi:hypothetical protein
MCNRRPGSLSVGAVDVRGWTYNRTRPDGPVDARLSVWRVDDAGGRPLAAVVGFAAHPVVQMALGAADLSRDWPGQMTDYLESVCPGLTAMFFQGPCGDVNFLPAYHEPDQCLAPGRSLGQWAAEVLDAAEPAGEPRVGCACRAVTLPTRRWTGEEVRSFRDEGAYRLASGDTAGWLDGIAKVIVNQPRRLPERYGGDEVAAMKAVARFAVEWGDRALVDRETRPETLTTEVQALRVGDAWLVGNPAELFTTSALELRRRWPHEHLLLAGYANDSIGYVPDAHDIERGSYAALQSPKFKDQFPFTAATAPALIDGMLAVLEEAAGSEKAIGGR